VLQQIAPKNYSCRGGFDGKLGLWPVVRFVRAQRRSRYTDVGELRMEEAMMNVNMLCEMVKDKLTPEICLHITWARKVTVQMDSAGGHGGGKGDCSAVIRKLNTIAKEELESRGLGEIELKFECQPKKSPDLNVLDLGAWFSIQSKVPAVRYEHNPEKKMIDRLHECVFPLCKAAREETKAARAAEAAACHER